LHITTADHSGFLPAPIRITLNDLECPIQFKVRMSHGLLADSVDTSLASLLYSCTRSSATAERQRVSYTRLSRLTHWSCTSL